MESPQRLRAALSDVLGPSARAQRASVDAICPAAEDGVSRDLASARAAGLLSDDTISALARRLVGRGLSQEMATRTVRDLAGAQSSSSSSGSSSAVVEQTRLAGTVEHPADEPAARPRRGALIPSPGRPRRPRVAAAALLGRGPARHAGRGDRRRCVWRVSPGCVHARGTGHLDHHIDRDDDAARDGHAFGDDDGDPSRPSPAG